MNPFICPWETSYLFIAETVPPLLYYSHIPAVVVALLVGGLIFFSDHANRKSTYLLMGMLILFAVWSVCDLFLWSNNRTDLTLFWWSLQIFIELVIYLFAFILVHRYLFKKFLNPWLYAFLLLILIPGVVLMPTSLYLVGIMDYCVAEESPFIVYYSYFFEILVILAILIATTYAIVKKKAVEGAKLSITFSSAILVFLIAFTSGNIIGSLTENWNMAQFGLFGMPIFIGILAYMIVQFKAFNVKLLAAQALVVGLIVIVASMALFTRSTVNLALIGINFVLVTLGGYLLIRSVKREVKQREEIQKLAEDLQKANERLKVLDKMKSEFVSIASHQLRSPITAIRGYISMLLEGSYGNFPDKAKQVLQNISDSSKYMALSIEDYLNVSRIEAGNMKYEMSEFNLKDEASKIVDELRQVAMKKGLVLVFRSECSGSQMVRADIGKTRQVIINIIDNAIKYTQKGTITVLVHDDVKKNKIWVSVNDTGIGMDKETQGEVFEKFIRAKNANEINVTGTGLGLYVAKKIISEMKGKIWAESEGVGKGSTFHIEFPMLSGKQNPSK